MTPETLRNARAAVEFTRLAALKQLKREDLNDVERNHWRAVADSWTRTAEELEAEELRQ